VEVLAIIVVYRYKDGVGILARNAAVDWIAVQDLFGSLGSKKGKWDEVSEIFFGLHAVCLTKDYQSKGKNCIQNKSNLRPVLLFLFGGRIRRGFLLYLPPAGH
jgi:hypothetical protein